MTPRDERGLRHPARVIESATLRGLRRPPVAFPLAAEGLRKGVSDMQRETIEYLCHSLRARGLFLLGDGTGVGKGRVLAGTIAEYLTRHGDGVRCLWCSANRKLHADALRDLKDVGAPPIARFTADFRASDREAVPAAFVSYSTVAYDEAGECLQQLVEWMRQRPVRLLLLDEAHLLRRRSASAARIRALVERCAPCHVVYSTATLASHPAHLRFVARILGGERALEALLRGGRGALELVAVDLKMRGLAVSRQLDYSACSFRVVEHAFSAAETQLYDECLRLLQEARAAGPLRQMIVRALVARFKVRTVLHETRRALARGRSVVVALQHTGAAAATREATASCVVDAMRRLGCDVPAELGGLTNAIDELVLQLHDEFGVAEITGRRARLQRVDGAPARVPVPPIKREIEAFQSGTKRVAVLSRAGSTGIGLHGGADDAARTHILLELAWSAEDHLQQCGRTFRADSGAPAEYLLVSSSSVIDARVERAIRGRLANLGAVTHADRTACARFLRDVEEVSASGQKMLAAHLALAQAVRRRPEALDDAAARTPLKAARARLGCRDSAAVPKVVYECLADADPPPAQVALCVAALEPAALDWTQRDEPRDARRLPAALGAQASAVRQAWHDPRSRLSLLPESVTEAVIDHLLEEYLVGLEPAADLADAFDVCTGSLWTLATRPLEWNLNRACALPLSLQTVLTRLMRSHAPCRVAAPIVRALEEVLCTTTTRVAAVALVQQTPHRSILDVRVVTALDAASVHRRVSDGRTFLVLASTGGVVLRDADTRCAPTRVDAAAWAAMVADGSFVPCAKEEEASILEREGRAATRCARRLTGRYTVVHAAMLEHWSRSHQVLVRFRAENCAGSHVGLLLEKHRALTQGCAVREKGERVGFSEWDRA